MMDTPEQPALRVERLRKAFGAVQAVDDVSFEVRRGGVLGVLGPSGCGKTTVLRLIAGFERPDAGTIEIGGRQVADPRRQVPPERRRVGMVFQEAALFPHLDVAANIGFGLPRSGSAARIAELTAMVGLAGLSARMPHELSGGQQQRVALARALAPEPELILLDEPFSSLDATLRAELRDEVQEILRVAGATVVFVTHDREEALAIADRVAVMRAGRIEQVSPPAELYLRPVNRFVAAFVGHANLVPGRVVDGEVQTALGAFRVPHGSLPEGAVAEALLRPEQLHLMPVRGDAAAEPVFRVERRSFHGAQVRYRVSAGGIELEAVAPSTSVLSIGAEVVVHARARQVPIYLETAAELMW
jgi:iron(III) transport system ATP-binding protein